VPNDEFNYVEYSLNLSQFILSSITTYFNYPPQMMQLASMLLPLPMPVFLLVFLLVQLPVISKMMSSTISNNTWIYTNLFHVIQQLTWHSLHTWLQIVSIADAGQNAGRVSNPVAGPGANDVFYNVE